ncbi:cystathionine beta-lyase [Penicillium malachiteum]|uniref:Cystathionine beta-lyase n=1 Tax=Penicillium malachiteum TaxID=1324776 RepID=A0AAD6HKG1_9EURO|nr:cystathionine beta-lyase [Penicillium malachiteum]
MIMGNVMGNLEGWLGLRSLRTPELRVKRHSDTAKALNPDSDIGRVVDSIKHASLQEEDIKDEWLMRQMPN